LGFIERQLRLLGTRTEFPFTALPIPITMIARPGTIFIAITAGNIPTTTVILGTDLIAGLLGVV